MPTELSLRELESRIGQEVGVSPWLEVTQERIEQFAKATDDYQWIHLDQERAKQSPFGTTIAHGFLTLSLVPKLGASTFSYAGVKMAVNYGSNKVRFISPVPSGSNIRARWTLVKVERLDGGAQVTWNCVIEREGGDKPAMAAETITRLYY